MEAIAMLISVALLVISVILHEVAHGYAANFLGDPTARLADRLTLNPLKHIDPFGSLILPGLMVALHSPILFGYAKPVPYNPHNLRGRYAETFVASAGVLTNFGIALVLGLILRFGGDMLSTAFFEIFSLTIYINLMLGVFNLIPIPPLDGSKVLGGVLTGRAAQAYQAFENRFLMTGPFIGFALVILLFSLFSPVFAQAISALYYLIVGMSF